MPILQHHIDDLKKIYRKSTGEVMTDAEAWEMAARLVNLFRLLLDRDDQANRKNIDSDQYEQSSI